MSEMSALLSFFLVSLEIKKYPANDLPDIRGFI